MFPNNSKENCTIKPEQVRRLPYQLAYHAGVEAYRQAEYNSAIEQFTITLHQNPAYLPAYKLRAFSYHKIRQFEAAIADFTYLLNQNVREPLFYLARAECYSALKKPSEAICDYSEFIKRYPQYPKIADVYSQRGSAYFDTQKYAEALADYTEAIQRDLNNTSAFYFNRGEVFCILNRHPDAINDYSAIIKREPQNAQVYNRRAAAFFNLQKFPEAISDFTEAIKYDPHCKNFSSRGDCYCNLEKYSDAISDYSNALRLNPEYAYAYLARSNTYLTLKEYDKSIDDFMCAHRVNLQTKELDWRIICNGTTYHTLSEILEQKIVSNPQESINYFQLGKIQYFELRTPVINPYIDPDFYSLSSYRYKEVFWNYIAAQQWAKPTENFTQDTQYNLTSFPPDVQSLQSILAASITQLKQTLHNGTITMAVISPPANFPKEYLYLFAQMATALLAFHLQTLTDLGLTHCVNYDNSRPVLSTLSMGHLTRLDLSHNPGVAGDVAEQLKNFPVLVELILRNNYLDADQLKNIVQAACEHGKLNFLDLGSNYVETAGRRGKALRNTQATFASQPQSSSHPALRVNLAYNFIQNAKPFTRSTRSLPLPGEQQGRDLTFYSSPDPLANVQSLIHPRGAITSELWLVFLYHDNIEEQAYLLFEGINKRQQRFLKRYTLKLGSVEIACLDPYTTCQRACFFYYQGFLIPRFCAQQILENIELDKQKRQSSPTPIYSSEPSCNSLAWAAIKLREGGLNISLPQPFPTPKSFLTTQTLVDLPLLIQTKIQQCATQ